LTTDSNEAAHGRFSRIRQVAPMCSHVKHASFGLPEHDPNNVSIGLVIFAQLTSECRRTCPGMFFLRKLLLCMGYSDVFFIFVPYLCRLFCRHDVGQAL